MGDLVLGTGGTLEVELPRAAGKIDAQILDEEDRVVDWISIEDGLGRSRPLAPGNYRVSIPAGAGDAGLHRDFVVVAGVETQLTFELEHP